MSAQIDTRVEKLVDHLRSVERIGAAVSLASWDQETYMPSAGGQMRSEVIGDLVGILHQRETSEELGDLISEAEELVGEEDSSHLAALTRETRRDYEKARRVPGDLAQEMARTTSEALQAWKVAREKDDFASFSGVLTRVMELKKRIAEAIRGGEGSASTYDILMDEYEPGMTSEVMQGLVDAVRPDLVGLVGEMAPVSREVDADFITAGYPSDQQLSFGKEVVEAMGFDFERGRLDLTTHPFCSEMGTSSDVRITTRVDEADFTSNLFSIIHEAGHGLYEQGLDPDWSGTPLGSSVSLGIHESQSRLWENNIARSAPFWRHWLPRMREVFPSQLEGVSDDRFLRGINRVTPSLIRVEADEVTYSLHVMLRFELEQGIFSGEIGVDDLPGLWREKIRDYLQVVPERDADGVLQDIHWSMGAFGYFPTYFLGNLYSAQIEVAARAAIPDLDQRLESGEMLTLRKWLEEKVHRCGRRFSAQELCRQVSGEDLDPTVYIDYLRRKYDSIYRGS